jgi:hypothetical protein
MEKLIDAMDMINFAKSYIGCIYMAAASLSRHQSEPISAVADMAIDKIQEAISLLEECNLDDGAPVSQGQNADFSVNC